MALEHGELRRRLAAARELIGLDQNAMGARLKKSGLGKTDAKRLERDTLEFSDSHLDAYVRITGLPAAWFTAEDWRPLISASAAADADPEVERLVAQRSVLKSTLAQVSEELEDLRKRRPLP
jgi:hypothetical protein